MLEIAGRIPICPVSASTTAGLGKQAVSWCAAHGMFKLHVFYLMTAVFDFDDIFKFQAYVSQNTWFHINIKDIQKKEKLYQS